MKFDKVVKRGMRHGDLPRGTGTSATYWTVIGFSEAAGHWFFLGWIDRRIPPPSPDVAWLWPEHEGYPRFEAFAPTNPDYHLNSEGPPPEGVSIGGFEKCRDAVTALRERAEWEIPKVD